MRWWLAAGMLVVGGCAIEDARGDKMTVPLGAEVPPASPAAAAAVKARDPDRTYVCEVERPTGSNFAVRTCRSLRQIEEERQHAQQLMQEVSRNNAQWQKK